MGVSGNRLTIRIERTANVNDDSDYSSVIIHNVNVGLNRAATSSKSSSDSFVPN